MVFGTWRKAGDVPLTEFQKQCCDQTRNAGSSGPRLEGQHEPTGFREISRVSCRRNPHWQRALKHPNSARGDEESAGLRHETDNDAEQYVTVMAGTAEGGRVYSSELQGESLPPGAVADAARGRRRTRVDLRVASRPRESELHREFAEIQYRINSSIGLLVPAGLSSVD